MYSEHEPHYFDAHVVEAKYERAEEISEEQGVSFQQALLIAEAERAEAIDRLRWDF